MRAFIFGLAAFSLVCLGVHAAADCVDDRIAQGVERIDEAADALFAKFELTRPLVDVVDGSLITRFGRVVALVWELVIDSLVGLSVFAYEKRRGDATSPSAVAREIMRRAKTARRDGVRAFATFLRPFLTACFVLAGGGAVARLAQGGLTLSLHALPGPLAGVVGQVIALAVLGCALVVLGVDAVAASFGRASDAREDELTVFVRTWKSELWVAALGLPLAYLAVFEAASLGAFLR